MSAFNGKSTADDVVRGLDVSLAGQAIVVTGANSGFGFHSAKALSRTGARVVLACRSQEAAAAAAAAICEEVPDAAVEVMALDLGSLASVRSFADAFNANVQEPLKVLLMNAGLGYRGYHETKEGWEETVGVNHIGHFYLYQLLRERLEAAHPSRVVVVASDSHKIEASWLGADGAVPDAEALRRRILLTRDGYGIGHGPYNISKRLNCLFACTLARRMRDSGCAVSAFSLHPATMVNTGFARKWTVRLAMWISSFFTRTVPQGAATQTWAAIAPDMEQHSGEYFDECAVAELHPDARHEGLGDAVWSLTEQLIQEALAAEGGGANAADGGDGGGGGDSTAASAASEKTAGDDEAADA